MSETTVAARPLTATRDGVHAPSEPRPIALLAGCIALAAALLAVDCFTPRGVSVAALYVIPIALVQRAGSLAYTVIAGVSCAALASIGIVVSPDVGLPATIVLADYAIVLVIIGATTFLGAVANRRRTQLETVSQLLTMCAWTKKVKVGDQWVPIEKYLMDHLGVRISHGMTEEQAQKLLAEAGLEVRRDQ